MKQLKVKEIKQTRDQLLLEQGGLCGMCNQHIIQGQEVLDHNHTTGIIRGVCHRSCNSLEGVLINAVKRYAVRDLESFMACLASYHKTHEEDQTSLLHPSFKTPQARKELAKKRKARNKAKVLK